MTKRISSLSRAGGGARERNEGFIKKVYAGRESRTILYRIGLATVHDVSWKFFAYVFIVWIESGSSTLHVRFISRKIMKSH